MRTLRWPLVALTGLVLMAVLGACSSLTPAPSLASGEAALLRGGGVAIANGQYAEGVVVSGTGMASAEPEMARVGFGIDLQGQNPDELVSEAAEKMDAAMAVAQAFGILEDETRTQSYNLWIENVHDPETGRPTGEIVYHLSHQVQVATDQVSAVGGLLADIVNAGANAISGVEFTVEEPAALVEQAREAALADAAASAEHIAEQLGVSLGRPIVVTEGGGNHPVFADRGIGGDAVMTEAAAPNVDPGSFSVSVTVQIVYEIR